MFDFDLYERFAEFATDIIKKKCKNEEDYLEIFYQRRIVLKIIAIDSKVTKVKPFIKNGISIRGKINERHISGSTSIIDKSLNTILDYLCVNTGCINIAIKDFDKTNTKKSHDYVNKMIKLESSKMKELTINASKYFLEKKQNDLSVKSRALLEKHNIVIVNSECCKSNENITNRSIKNLAYQKSNKNATPIITFSGQTNNSLFWENYQVNDDILKLNEGLVCQTKGKNISRAKCPVILGAGTGGILFHEACGHMLESDKFKKKSSIFYKSIGEKIAPEYFSLIDDPTINGLFGSRKIDDEGTPTTSKILIENGIVKNLLSNKINRQSDYSIPGNSRCSTYTILPTPRMSNTYVKNGDLELSNMLASIESGIYCKEISGGMVSPSGQFSFYSPIAYLIQEGKVTSPLKGVTISSDILKTLKCIEMIGNDLTFVPGYCINASGKIPVTVGSPHVLIKTLDIKN